VPIRERSRSLALVYSGMFVGSILGLSASPQLIAAFGWPSVFYIFGSLGLVWFAFWNDRAASSPAQDPRLSADERAFIAANTAPQARVGAPVAIPWAKLLSRKEVWALIVCHFCHNWGTFILLTWMPSYYSQARAREGFKGDFGLIFCRCRARQAGRGRRRSHKSTIAHLLPALAPHTNPPTHALRQVLGLDLARSGTLSVLPWVTMAAAANLGGWLADTLVVRGASVTVVRKVMQTIGFLGPAFFLTQLSSATTAMQAVLCMMGAQGLVRPARPLLAVAARRRPLAVAARCRPLASS
jgi:ACS family sodium-dependent inorganic phosphate cotransporter